MSAQQSEQLANTCVYLILNAVRDQTLKVRRSFLLWEEEPKQLSDSDTQMCACGRST